MDDVAVDMQLVRAIVDLAELLTMPESIAIARVNGLKVEPSS